MYVDKLYGIVNKYNNTSHKTIKIKPVDVIPSLYFYFNKENNKEDPKLKVVDHVRISKYEKRFGKGYVPNWSNLGEVIRPPSPNVGFPLITEKR